MYTQYLNLWDDSAEFLCWIRNLTDLAMSIPGPVIVIADVFCVQYYFCKLSMTNIFVELLITGNWIPNQKKKKKN